VAHSLRAEGFDASEDGTGRGTPIIPIQEVGARTGKSTDDPRAGIGIGGEGDPMFSLQAGKQHGIAIPFDTTQVTSPGNYSEPKPGDPCHPLAKGQHPPCIAFTGMAQAGAGWAPPSCPTCEDMALPLDATRAQAVAYDLRNNQETGGVPFVISGRDRGDDGRGYEREPHISALPQVDATKPDRVVSGMVVRRLTPVECSRLMGFSDNYLTQVTYRGKCPPADGLMYRALGNSFAVPVVRWIGERILAVAAAVGMEQQNAKEEG